MSKSGILTVCTLAFALAASAPFRAADPAPAEPAQQSEEPQLLGDFVEYIEINVSSLPASNTISTRLPLEAEATPANVGSVSEALIREQRDVLLGEALWNVSGVNVVAGAGVYDHFVVRGFDGLENGMVLTDGAAEPETTLVPLYNVQGVELLKGPAGYLFGANPLAGVVNVVRKQPLPADFGVVEAALGSFGTRDGRIDWNLANDDGAKSLRLNGLWRGTDNYRDDKDSRHVAVNPSFTWRPSERSSLNFNLEYVDAEASPDSGLPLLANGQIADVPRRRSYQSPFDFSEQEIYRLQVDFETKLGDRMTLRNKTYYRDLDWQTDGTLFLGSADLGDPSGPTLFRTLTRLDDRQRFSGNQLELLVEPRGQTVKHHLLAGLELAHRTDDFDTAIDFALPPIAVFDPQESATSTSPQPFVVGDATYGIVAPYLIDQMEIGRRLQLLIGARYDAIDTEVDFSANAQEPGIQSFSRNDGELSPMIGAVVAAGRGLSFYGNAGRSFAPHQARLREAGTLDPEKSTQVELGARKKLLNGKLQTTFAAYRLERENIAISDPNGITQQAGDQRSDGFEVELAAEPAPRLRTLLAYAYNDAELTRFTELVPTGPGPMDFIVLDRSGNAPPFAPRQLVSLWVSRSFDNGLGLAGGARYFSDQFIDEDNAFEIDGAVIVDATVFYDWGECRVKLNVKNLTDKEYETRGFGPNSVTPANPFSAYAGFEYKF